MISIYALSSMLTFGGKINSIIITNFLECSARIIIIKKAPSSRKVETPKSISASYNFTPRFFVFFFFLLFCSTTKKKFFTKIFKKKARLTAQHICAIKTPITYT